MYRANNDAEGRQPHLLHQVHYSEMPIISQAGRLFRSGMCAPDEGLIFMAISHLDRRR